MLICKEWLRVCDDQHRHTDSHVSTLPTRVLDVGDGASDTVFLRTTTKAQGTYIALSHRWHHDTPTTVHANLDARRAGIKVSDLPAIYQDAIRFTQNLGVRFLWIDSLCIVQDDRTDWYFESQNMATVFASAYVTIAISPSADVTGNPSFEQDVEKGELSSRAWILQERALARRTIHFTPGQTYWECGAVIWSLTEDEGERPSTALSSSNFPQAGPQNAPEDGQAVFKQIFEHYSRLRITVKGDRPIAVWGLEDRLSAFYGTDSFYGIVKSFFPESLLWQRGSVWMEPLVNHKEDIHSLSRENLMVPSWSWMAYTGDIRYKPIRPESLSWRNDIFLACRQTGDETKKQPGVISTKMSRSFCVLTVTLAKMRSGCQFDYLEDTNCRVTYGGDAVGWARYDCENTQKAGRLECVRLAEGCTGWEDYAGVNSDEWGLSGQVSFLMLLEPLAKGIYHRIGVGVVLSKHLSRRGKTVQVF
ncbi:HET-domain-containing protein [Thozetella sp. PMI_491]|nr:HET-domain-containing protein [Thozetella sp. PMI_491]